MSAFSPAELESNLRTCLPAEFSGELCVALSGGLDSSVLLHALSQVCALRSDWRLRAIHVDHQLHASSNAWAQHCVRQAHHLKIDLQVVQVSVPRDSADGLEAAARKVRYAALRQHIKQGEILLTAHHADDQLETVLLALLRGSGIRGLAAMPPSKSFGIGWHVRPLLAFTRIELACWASEQGIANVEDPSNAELRHDRNYLRQQVVPTLRTRWPHASTSVARAALHVGEAHGLLDEMAQADLKICAVKNCLRVGALKTLNASRRRNLLRYWLHSCDLRMPSQRKLQALEIELLHSAGDRCPCVEWEGAEVRRHRDLLYANSARENFVPMSLDWNWREPLELPFDLGRLELRVGIGKGLALTRLPPLLSVKFREGGEQIRMPGRTHRHELKKFLQESGVLPWWRTRLPLLYAERQLLAVADLIIDDAFVARAGESSVEVCWEGKPEVFAVAQ